MPDNAQGLTLSVGMRLHINRDECAAMLDSPRTRSTQERPVRYTLRNDGDRIRYTNAKIKSLIT
jgi:hypothetical protein